MSYDRAVVTLLFANELVPDISVPPLLLNALVMLRIVALPHPT